MKKSQPLEELGLRIAKIRKKKRITLERLATQMEISKGNLCDIEHGRKDPRFSTLKAIADGLGVSLARLFKEF